jgi:cob(I)alamin adenosyltransferase
MAKQQQRGLLLINTGNGKGKTTAALGTAFRALGHGMRVAVLQFIKGKWRTGERRLGQQTENLIWLTMGNGCTLQSTNLNRHRAAAHLAWEKACELLGCEDIDLLVLDEILYAIKLDLISVTDVKAALATRRHGLHVILTGRYAPPDLIEIADLVTEMRSIKHPFQQGERARIGLDF